ncbi:major tail protein [Mechercharimyces sp. CAU 1602]|uniref:major tail protein n=1 Tax=Mechercharimyces sp. CAU 1602 TaxID=2973933 RepID=UPI00216320ED|nr:major tail protein [Mechercharimyces sp. CAU 1602]MCS1351147.1 phage tail protein [Mechercharimyces sp. CAU 1602]
MATQTQSGQVGLKDLYVAILTKDDGTGVEYEAPFKLAPAVNAKVSPKVESAVDYGDDGAVETATALGEIDVELEVNSLTIGSYEKLMGHTYMNGMLVKNADDISPYVALGFRSAKGDGSEVFVWLYKGRFQAAEQEYKTKEGNIQFQHPKLKGTFVNRSYDNNWMISGDSSDTEFGLKDMWFTEVIEKDTVAA